MTNLDVVIAVLAKHREARLWTDAAVAHELCTQLGVDETAKATHFIDLPDPDVIVEAEVVALEAAAGQAADNAKGARVAFDAQTSEREAAKAEAKRLADEPARVKETGRLADERLAAADAGVKGPNNQGLDEQTARWRAAEDAETERQRVAAEERAAADIATQQAAHTEAAERAEAARMPEPQV